MRHRLPLPLHLRQITRPHRHLTEPKKTFFVGATFFMVSLATAQSVYRCADQYSANPSCNGATVTYFDDARNARQAQTQKTQTLQAQQEADALEKNRLKAEQQSKRSTALPPTVYNRDALLSSTVDHKEPVQPSHGKHRKQASPYFTAKDNTPKPTKPKAEKNGASPKAAP